MENKSSRFSLFEEGTLDPLKLANKSTKGFVTVVGKTATSGVAVEVLQQILMN
jgi:hypothetical protein